jgi:hypothetical protein
VSETFWIALMTGGIALVGTLGGVALTQRSTRKVAELTQIEERRREVRRLVAELVHTGRQWVKSQEIFLPSLYKAALDWDKFFGEYVETDSGKQMSGQTKDMSRLTGELQLVVKDPTLLVLLDLFEIQHEGYADSCTGPLIKTAKEKRGVGDFEVLLEALRYARSIGDSLDRIQARAATLLRGELGNTPAPWWRRTARTTKRPSAGS